MMYFAIRSSIYQKKALEFTEVPDEVYLNMAFEFENNGKTDDAIYYFCKTAAARRNHWHAFASAPAVP